MAVTKIYKPTILSLNKIDIVNCSCGMDHLNFPIANMSDIGEWYTHIFVCPVNKTRILIKFAYQ